MYTLKVVLLFIILFYASISAQFFAERLITDPFTQNISSLKDSLGTKAFEESEIKELTTITYYDWLEPVSIKITYMFKKDGAQVGKFISNAKQNEEDAEKTYNLLKRILVNKFGSSYTETSLLGLTMLMWKGDQNATVMLIRKGTSSKLTVMKI
ncbi:MAG: hypothetical protein Q8L04_15215 [Ignavibacteria bacterium]|nr:hypothetical protein [Ignavibacteria bacterium]